MAQLDDQATLIRQLQSRLAVLDAAVLSGNGSPEGVVTAPVGTLYRRKDGGIGSTLWVKEAGSGSTGWASK